MAENKDVFVFIATYDNVDEAWQDYDTVKELHKQKAIGTYDAAVVEKDAEGKVHVHKHEKPAQHGFWTGAGVGAVVGILFPPSVIGSAAVGGAAGALIGHLRRGMARGDMKDLGETLDAGTAALVVLGESQLSEKIATATTHAQKTTEKKVNVKAKDFDKELAAAAPAGS